MPFCFWTTWWQHKIIYSQQISVNYPLTITTVAFTHSTKHLCIGSRIILSERTLEFRKSFHVGVWQLVRPSTSLQASWGKMWVSISSMSWRCCAAELSAVQVRSKWLFLLVGLVWEWGGVQASDGCLMGLGAHTQLNDRFGPRAESQSRLPSSRYWEKALSTCQQDSDTGGVGPVHEMEPCVELCCGWCYLYLQSNIFILIKIY